jgi:hypothetical protein
VKSVSIATHAGPGFAFVGSIGEISARLGIFSDSADMGFTGDHNSLTPCFNQSFLRGLELDHHLQGWSNLLYQGDLPFDHEAIAEGGRG